MCSSLHRQTGGMVMDAVASHSNVAADVQAVAVASLPSGTSSSAPTVGDERKEATTPKRIRGVDGFRQRAAALCLRRNSGGSKWEVLVVSGRSGKDYWVLPGGGLEHEESAEEAVIREFREEAGVQGAIVAPIGEFTVGLYNIAWHSLISIIKDEERCHRTVLFLISVMEMFDDWEDFRTGRQRRWMAASETLQKIKKNQLEMVETSLRIAVEILDKQHDVTISSISENV